jgi:hypothetical protein
MRQGIQASAARRLATSLPGLNFPSTRSQVFLESRLVPANVLKIDHVLCDHHERVIRRKLVWACLMGARYATSNGFGRREQSPCDLSYLAAPSILETGRSAVYSSLRRKKIHSLPGDSRLHARIVKNYDLIEEGLCWEQWKGMASISPRLSEFIRQVKTDFVNL